MRRPFHVYSHAQVARNGNIVAIQADDRTQFVPIESVSEFYMFGEVNTSKRFLELSSKHGVLVHYFNDYGHYVGTYYPLVHYSSGYMLLQQVAAYMDETKRMDLAARFVSGSIRNMANVLSYYSELGADVDAQLQACNAAIDQVRIQDSSEGLMALLVNTKETYYHAFDAILASSEFSYKTKRPNVERNRLDALIRLGHAYIYSAVLCEIYKTRLDPRIGYLNATHFRGFSLNLDVGEVFKPIIVDRCIFDVVSEGVINPSSFIEQSEGVRLSEVGWPTFVGELDKRLDATVQGKPPGKGVTYRRLIRLELYKIEKHLMEDQEYEPYVARW